MRSIIFALPLLLFIGCSEDKEVIIPNVSFSGSINLSSPDYLLCPFVARVDMLGQPLGIAGVVVYRVNPESYYVYDRMCPHERSTSSLVTTLKGEEAIVVCPTCGSRFLLSGGGADVVNGPAVYPLKSYNNRYEASDNTLSVWN